MRLEWLDVDLVSREPRGTRPLGRGKRCQSPIERGVNVDPHSTCSRASIRPVLRTPRPAPLLSSRVTEEETATARGYVVCLVRPAWTVSPGSPAPRLFS